MSLLRSLVAPTNAMTSRSLENPSVSLLDADAWAEAFGLRYESESREQVSPGRALSISAFWSAVGQIAGTSSRIPLVVKRLGDDGERFQPDPQHYLNDLIGPAGQPNADLSALKFWRRIYTHALIYNNAFVWLEWSNSGRITSMVQLLSDRTDVVRISGRQYVVTEVGDDGRIVARPYDEVLHIEGLCVDGLAGCDTVAQAREDLGNALAARRFKSKFFGQGMHAGGILQVPPGAKPDAAKKVEQAIQDQHTTTSKAFRTLVLRDGFKWFSTQVNPEQAQMTESDESAVRDIARRFMLAPARLGVRESISYNSLEQERRDFHDTTLAFWLSMAAGELNQKALRREERRSRRIEHGLNLALVFADANTLANIGNGGLQNGWLHRDEVRGWFGLSPRDDLTPAAGAGSDQSQVRSAHRRLLEAELQRLVRRINVHAERAARRDDPAAWQRFLDDLETRHADVARQALEPVVQVCHAAGVLALDHDHSHMTSDLFRQYRQVATRSSQADVSAIVDQIATTYIEEQQS